VPLAISRVTYNKRGTLRSARELRHAATGSHLGAVHMSLRLRKRIRGRHRRPDTVRDAGYSIGRTNAALRWGVSYRAASSRAAPRLGALLLAIIVVGLLTAGLHVLFQ